MPLWFRDRGEDSFAFPAGQGAPAKVENWIDLRLGVRFFLVLAVFWRSCEASQGVASWDAISRRAFVIARTKDVWLLLVALNLF